MSKISKILIVAVLIIAVGVVIAFKQKQNGQAEAQQDILTDTPAAVAKDVNVPQQKPAEVYKKCEKTPQNITVAPAVENTPPTPTAVIEITSAKPVEKLPKLVDLGADKCIPCKMMAPILEELETRYEGVMEVEFIDVWKNSDEARHHGVRVIPTQIFYDADGNELFRHEGFFSKEDILNKWKELGLDLEKIGK